MELSVVIVRHICHLDPCSAHLCQGVVLEEHVSDRVDIPDPKTSRPVVWLERRQAAVAHRVPWTWLRGGGGGGERGGDLVVAPFPVPADAGRPLSLPSESFDPVPIRLSLAMATP